MSMAIAYKLHALPAHVAIDQHSLLADTVTLVTNAHHH